MGDKGGINNYNSYKLKAEDLTRPWAIGPANFVPIVFWAGYVIYSYNIYIYIYIYTHIRRANGPGAC